MDELRVKIYRLMDFYFKGANSKEFDGDTFKVHNDGLTIEFNIEYNGMKADTRIGHPFELEIGIINLNKGKLSGSASLERIELLARNFDVFRLYLHDKSSLFVLNSGSSGEYEYEGEETKVDLAFLSIFAKWILRRF
jgi:hypothetical protein